MLAAFLIYRTHHVHRKREADERSLEVFNLRKITDWAAASGESVPAGATYFVGVDYNSGSPQIVVNASETWDYLTTFPLGTVVRLSFHPSRVCT